MNDVQRLQFKPRAKKKGDEVRKQNGLSRGLKTEDLMHTVRPKSAASGEFPDTRAKRRRDRETRYDRDRYRYDDDSDDCRRSGRDRDRDRDRDRGGRRSYDSRHEKSFREVREDNIKNERRNAAREEGEVAEGDNTGVQGVPKAFFSTILPGAPVYEADGMRLTTNELKSIKNHYLGVSRNVKKLQKPSEKFRNVFQFEWDDTDDTTLDDTNPLYNNRLEPQLLFGRGFKAGLDIREQRKNNNFYDLIVMNRINQGQIDGLDVEVYMERRESAANKRRGGIHDEESGEATHWSDKRLEDMNSRDWRILREDYEIQLKGGKVPPPARNWEETKLPDAVLKAIAAVGYERPSAIQMQAIPIAMELRDLIGIAETGSGKTAAFCLPMLAYIDKLPRQTSPAEAVEGPYSLILAPSRELAQQIEGEYNKFAKYIEVKCVSCVGGLSIDVQAFQLRQGCETIIGTPGRLKDILDKAYTVLNQCYYVILDEADKMIDLGFEETVNYILDQIPDKLKADDEEKLEEQLQCSGHLGENGILHFRLTQLFSATMPNSVERMARRYLRHPSYISIGDPGAGKESIAQLVEMISEGKKISRCLQLLEEYDPPMIIFTNLKKVVDVLQKKFSQAGWSCVGLHGGKSQDVRQGNLELFKNGEVDLLVATDVAGRGIDVDDVSLVVNFDMPKDIEAYTHRIGRTGRAGKTGTAVTFLTENDSASYYDLKQFLEKTGQVVPPELARHEATKLKLGTMKDLI